MSVVVVLLGLLLPAIGRAREEGQAAHCLATLHKNGAATTLYHADNEDSFWPYFVDIAGPEGGRRWWFGFEPGGPASNPQMTHRPLDKAAGFLGPYLTGTAADFRCPSFPYEAGKYFPKFSPTAGGYGYNTAALGGYDQLNAGKGAPARLQQLDGRTADVFVLADGIHFDKLDYSSAPPLDQTFNEPAYIQWQPPSLFGGNVGVNGGLGHFRHNGRAAVVFVDGHAAVQPVRRPLHPYSHKGYGSVANLSDESLRVKQLVKGNQTLEIDVIYGIP